MTGAYDSLRKKIPRRVLVLQTMVRTQKTQRQERFSTMSPPKRGPRVGPMSGPRRYQPNIPARSSGRNMSLIVPPPLAMPTPGWLLATDR